MNANDTTIPGQAFGPGDDERWAAEFNVTASQIRDAVQAVGPRKPDVEMYISGSRTTTDAEAVKAAGN